MHSPVKLPEPRPFMHCIEFNDVPDGTVIDQHYAKLGVTFSAYKTGNVPPGTLPTKAPAYARSWRTNLMPSPPTTGIFTPIPHAGSNCVSIESNRPPAFDMRYGFIEASFAIPQRVVSVLLRTFLDGTGLIWDPAHPMLPPSSSSQPFLEAYDASGQLIGQAFSRIGLTGFQTLRFASAQANIAEVRFSIDGSFVPYLTGYFDRLCFSEVLVPIAFRLP